MMKSTVQQVSSVGKRIVQRATPKSPQPIFRGQRDRPLFEKCSRVTEARFITTKSQHNNKLLYATGPRNVDYEQQLCYIPTWQQKTKVDAESNRFDRLVTDIRTTLGPSSGLTCNDINIAKLEELMRNYISDSKEWMKYALGDSNVQYTRNLVDDCNEKANLLILVWSPGKKSPIHDHGNAHCLMRVLHGELTETRYAFPDNDKEKAMTAIRKTSLKNGDVAYMADDLGLHSMGNPSLNDVAVSLHLYTPPNVARKGCNIFDPATGNKTHIRKCQNYSEFGRIV